MKLLCVFTVAFFVVASALESCNQNDCKIPDCQCSTMDMPVENPPQLVILSFDDSAAKTIYDDFYKPVLLGRKNPDECPISGTLFVPHEYSDYEVVNSMYNAGFEIGSHSITKNSLMTYWRDASKNTLVDEMMGQKKIISKFANIPEDKIRGARIPLLQINENTFEALKEGGFDYDNSWPTFRNNPFFPYTLDYESDQMCPTTCQESSIPGFWIVPIVDWVDMESHACNKLLACSFNGTEDQIFNWMKENFDAIYNNPDIPSKAPFGLLINSAVFSFVDNSRSAFIRFLDHLQTLEDVFIVSAGQAMDWMKNPVAATEYKSCNIPETAASCRPVTCVLKKPPNDDQRYMRSCVKCPKAYPWLGNPEGNK